MDLLYSKYSNPLELMRLYIEQGQFGEWVSSFLEMHYKQKEEEAKKEEERKAWELYIHSFSDKSFVDWKKEAMRISEPKQSHGMSDDQVDAAKEQARGILKRFSPQ